MLIAEISKTKIVIPQKRISITLKKTRKTNAPLYSPRSLKGSFFILSVNKSIFLPSCNSSANSSIRASHIFLVISFAWYKAKGIKVAKIIKIQVYVWMTNNIALKKLVYPATTAELLDFSKILRRQHLLFFHRFLDFCFFDKTASCWIAFMVTVRAYALTENQGMLKIFRGISSYM